MTTSSNVIESSVSYYNQATKKWDSGHFTLSKSHVQFVDNSSEEDNQFHLCLTLNSITGIEKRNSNFIRPCLVICVGSEKHWFGSFPSRDAIYNLLELFWHEALISKPHRKSSPHKINESYSITGTQLLGILHESRNNLIETANVLSDQSRQLIDTEEAVEDVNSDLTKAETLIKTGSLTLPLVSLTNSQDNAEVPSHRYKVNFSFSNTENKTDWESGVLIISNDVILLKNEEHLLMQATKDELESLQVLSPWELCVIHNFSGVEKSCYFMCPQLSRLLKFVASISHYKNKILYVDDDSSAYDTASCYSSSSFGSATNSPTLPINESGSLRQVNSNSVQIKVSNGGMLSNEEIQEIQSVLQNLQALAAEVGREQENQLEKVTALVESIEQTELRIKKNNESLKK